MLQDDFTRFERVASQENDRKISEEEMVEVEDKATDPDSIVY